MKPLIKSAFCIFLISAVFAGCKKEYSCERDCIVSNQPPVANAGPNQTIILPVDSLMLDGSASKDPDGTIKTYQWTKIAGPASSAIKNTAAAKTPVNKLITGSYQFELKVTDNGGLSGKDTMKVIVTDPSQPNHPPVARAGNDTVIILPANTAILNGSGSTDPDNNIASYAWTKISGPSSFTISKADAVKTPVTNLAQGSYQFELLVKDSGGLSSKDTVQVVVVPAKTTGCDISTRPLINAQLTPVAVFPPQAGTSLLGSAGNKLLFWGALCSNCLGDGMTRIDLYDLVTHQWSFVNLKAARSGSMAVVSAGNKLFIAGGYDTDGTSYSAVFSDVDIYDASTDTWSVASLSVARSNLTGVASGNKIFFAGGWYRDPGLSAGQFGYLLSNTVDIYDLSTNTWSTNVLSEARSDLSAVAVNNKVYFAGGFGNNGATISSKVDIYDNASGTWSVTNMGKPRYAMAAAVAGNNILWAGGFQELSTQTAEVEIKNTTTNTTTLSCLFEPQSWLGNFPVTVQKNNQIIFFSGDNYAGEKNKFDIYDVSTDKWSIGVMQQEMVSHIVSVNNTLYVTGDQQLWKLDF